MATLEQLEDAEAKGTIGPKSLAALTTYRSQQSKISRGSKLLADDKNASAPSQAKQDFRRAGGGGGFPYFTVPKMTGDGVVAGAERGVAKTVEAATTPTSLAIGAGAMALPFAGVPASVVSRVAGAAMLPPTVVNAIRAYMAKNSGDKAEYGTEALLTGLGAVAGLAGGKTGAPEGESVTDLPPRQVSDYLKPVSKSKAAGVEIAGKQMEQAATSQASGATQEKLGTLRTSKARGVELYKSAVTAAKETYQQTIESLKDKLSSAVDQNIPALKTAVLKLHKGMMDAYDTILDKASEGKTFLRSDYNQKVIEPVLEAMTQDNVPEDAPIWGKIRGLKGEKAEPEASTETTKTPEQLMTARDFKHVGKQFTDAMTPSVRGRSSPAGMYDNWLTMAKGLHGKYLEVEVPELAEANRDYARMAFIRKQLWAKAKPFTQDDVRGASSLLQELASGKVSPQTRAVVKLAEEGTKNIPGIGKGELGKGVMESGRQLTEAQKGHQILSAKMERDFTAEQNGYREQIRNGVQRIKQLQSERADATVEIRKLQALQRRYDQIANWRRGLLWGAAGTTYLGRQVAPMAKQMMNMP